MKPKTELEKSNEELFDKIKEAEVTLSELEKLLEERIVDLHQVRGGQAERHLFVFYREKVWKSLRALRQ